MTCTQLWDCLQSRNLSFGEPKTNHTNHHIIHIIDDASSIIMFSSNLFCEGAHPTWNSPKFSHVIGHHPGHPPSTWMASDGSSSPVFIGAKALKNGTLVHRSQGVSSNDMEVLELTKPWGEKKRCTMAFVEIVSLYITRIMWLYTSFLFGKLHT